MSWKKLDLFNLALDRAGEKDMRRLDDTGKTPDTLNRSFPVVWGSLLELGDWAFARETVALVQATAPDIGDQWLYEYDYPAGCAAVRRVHSSKSEVPQAYEIRKRVGAQEKSIFSNTADAYVTHTRLLDADDDADLALIDTSFVNALRDALAADIVMAVTQDPKRYPTVVELMQMSYNAALQVTHTERERLPSPTPRSIMARRLGVGGYGVREFDADGGRYP